MRTRAELEASLDHLAAMLPPWLARLRHESQFWPQFRVLAREILDDAELGDRSYVIQRIEAMLATNGKSWPAD